MDQQIKDYIQQSRASGVQDTDIKHNLLTAGWLEADVNAALAGTSSVPVPVKTSKVSKKILLSILAVVVLVGGGYFIYTKAYNSPSVVLASFVKNPTFNIMSPLSHVEISAVADAKQGDKTTNYRLGAKVDYDYSSKDHPLGDSFVSAKFDFLGTAIEFNDLEVRNINNKYYLNVSKLPLISDMAKDYDGWVLIENTDLKNEAGVDSSKEITAEQAFKGVNVNSVFTKSKYIGAESVVGIKSYRYSLEVDKKALTEALVQVGANIGAKVPAADIEDGMKDVVIKDLEIWIGVQDKQLHKVSLQTASNPGAAYQTDLTLSVSVTPGKKVTVTAPAKAYDPAAAVKDSSVDSSLGAARSQGANAQTIAEVRKLITALEMYYNDHNRYPDTLSALAPKYIEAITESPKFTDPICSGFKDIGYLPGYKAGTYTFKFCITEMTGDLTAGIHTVESGIIK